MGPYKYPSLCQTLVYSNHYLSIVAVRYQLKRGEDSRMRDNFSRNWLTLNQRRAFSLKTSVVKATLAHREAGESKSEIKQDMTSINFSKKVRKPLWGHYIDCTPPSLSFCDGGFAQIKSIISLLFKILFRLVN